MIHNKNFINLVIQLWFSLQWKQKINMFDIKLWTEHSTQRLPFIEDLYKSLLQTITKCSTKPLLHCHCKLFNVLNMQVHVYVHINHCKFSIIRYCNLTKFHIPAFLPTYKWNENHQDVQIRCKSVLNNNIYIRLRYLRTMETVKLPRTRFIKVGFLVQQFLRFCRFHVFMDFIKVLCLPLGSVLFLQWFISLVLLLPW